MVVRRPQVNICSLDCVKQQLCHSYSFHIDEMRLKESFRGPKPLSTNRYLPTIRELQHRGKPLGWIWVPLTFKGIMYSMLILLLNKLLGIEWCSVLMVILLVTSLLYVAVLHMFVIFFILLTHAAHVRRLINRKWNLMEAKSKQIRQT